MKFIKYFGDFIIFSSVVIIYILLRYNLLSIKKIINYIFPVCALGFFLIAYVEMKEQKKSEDNFEPVLFVSRKGLSMSIFIGVMLLFSSFVF